MCVCVFYNAHSAVVSTVAGIPFINEDLGKDCGLAEQHVMTRRKTRARDGGHCCCLRRQHGASQCVLRGLSGSPEGCTFRVLACVHVTVVWGALSTM